MNKKRVRVFIGNIPTYTNAWDIRIYREEKISKKKTVYYFEGKARIRNTIWWIWTTSNHSAWVKLYPVMKTE